jgi:hypothetical protein
VSIHSQQGPRPAPSVKVTIPENLDTGAAGPAPAPAEPPKLADVPPTVERREPQGGTEGIPMRPGRVRTIWSLMVVSLLPGVLAVVARDFWHGLPSWAHWTAYTFSGILILTAVGLIVKHAGAGQ